MRNRSLISIALVFSVAALATVGVRLATAQELRTGNQIRTISSFDYRLVHTKEHVYRYDTRTGATWLLVLTSAENSIKYEWMPVIDKTTPTAGDVDRYDVCEGTNNTGILVRIDRKTNRTWTMVSTDVKNWQEIVK